MYHFFIDGSQKEEHEIRITGSDVNHIKNVLRLKVGEEIGISDGNSTRYHGTIKEITKDEVWVEVLYAVEPKAELPVKIYLFQGFPKADKMEFIIQKAVELGVYAIVPIVTERTIVKLDEKKEEKKWSRYAAIAESAAKQSGRTFLPQILPLMHFSEALSFCSQFECRLIPYELSEGMEAARQAILEASKLKEGSKIAIFIGPEGGFSKKEIKEAIEVGINPISLGRRILRTETAGMALLSILMFAIEE